MSGKSSAGLGVLNFCRRDDNDLANSSSGLIIPATRKARVLYVEIDQDDITNLFPRTTLMLEGMNLGLEGSERISSPASRLVLR